MGPMTPSPDFDVNCTDCFLYAARGNRVCPMLGRQTQEMAEAERQTAVLRALIRAEALEVPDLAEQVQREAQGHSCEPSPSTQPVLAAAPNSLPSADSRKETTCHRLS